MTMIVSNPAYEKLNRHGGTRNRGHMNLDEFSYCGEPDWLFFTELNAHEAPNKKFLEIEE
jgi:hypothetical protein